MSHIAGPEALALASQRADSPATHRRKVSAARSLVGSLRGIGRKNAQNRASTPTKEVSPERPAENVPLPSSPIDIPVTAPALELDLGPAGFMPSAFGHSVKAEPTQDTRKLTDPANIGTGTPKTPVPAEMKVNMSSSVRQRDILRLPPGTVNDLGPIPPPGPTTPMPGTNLHLEVDGANAGNGEKSHVFERAVTPTNEKERKELRTMRSLDAMADACTVAHAHDDFLEQSKSSDTESQTRTDSPTDTASLNVGPKPPLRRNFASTSTANSCPSDMEELTPQKTVTAETLSADHSRESYTELPGIVSFVPGNDLGEGPPSPTRNVELPFRPKFTEDTVQAAVEMVEGDHQTRNSNVEPDEESEVQTPTPPTTPEQTLEIQLELQRNLAKLELPPEVPQYPWNTHDTNNIASDDDTNTRARELLTSNIILPNYDGTESDTEDVISNADGMSPHGGPLVPQLYYHIKTSHTPSPGSVRSRTTYIAGLGDAEYRFSFDNWLQNSSSTPVAQEEAKMPSRRSTDTSIDSVSTTEERQTPQISPRSTNPNHTPSMGCRLEFDLQHSQRNMRCNAVQQDGAAKSPKHYSPPVREAPRFIVGGSEETDGQGFQLADFESAYISSRENSPQKRKKPMQARDGRQDSVASSLKGALADSRQLKERLDTICTGSDGPTDSGDRSSEDTLPLSGVEVSIVELGEQRAMRSDAASPARMTAETKTSSAPMGALDSNDFSPTSAYDNMSPTRFAGLNVMETPSSLGHSGEKANTAGVTGLDSNDFSPTSAHDNTSPIRFAGLNIMEAVSSPSQYWDEEYSAEAPGSSPDTLSVIADLFPKDRVTSADSLDASLALFSSPDSGYRADTNSTSPESSNEAKAAPSGYRSLAKRRMNPKPLGEESKSVV